MKEDYYRGQVLAGLVRMRKHFFPHDESLKLLKITPEAGETEAAELISGWGGQRIATTTGSGTTESGGWQFQIAAADDWSISQAYVQQAIALRIGSRRWKIKKIEAPTSIAMVWKIKAEIQ